MTLPNGHPVLENFSLTLTRGETVQLVGDPNTGIALLKAIAGVWSWGQGNIILPDGETLAFVPQRPFLPEGPLIAALTYPRDPAEVERKRVIDFSDRYYKTPSGIVVKKGTPYTSPASLKGKKIGVLKGSTQEKWAMGELKPAGVTIIPYEAQDQVYLDIKSGRLDGTVADKVEVHGGFLRKPEGKDYGYAGTDQYDVKYYGDGIGIGMRKGQKELKDQINAAIKTIRSNGTYATIAKKYFDFDPYGN